MDIASARWAINNPFGIGYVCCFRLSGLVSFAPAIIIGYGLLDESIASTAFGALLLIAGVIGSPLGGYAVDVLCQSNPNDKYFRLERSALYMFIAVTIGVACLFVCLAIMQIKVLLFILFFIGILLLISTHTATVIVILMSVKDSQRGFAMGLCTFFLHLLGDVPSSVVIGALKDFWAPRCGSILDSNGNDTLDPKCYLDKDGLRYTLYFAFGWHVWTI